MDRRYPKSFSVPLSDKAMVIAYLKSPHEVVDGKPKPNQVNLSIFDHEANTKELDKLVNHEGKVSKGCVLCCVLCVVCCVWLCVVLCVV